MGLLERFATGDLEAFEVLFRQHQKEVYVWIVRIVRDSGIAEDLTVETFWRIYRSRERFNPQGNFQGWARRIATNIFRVGRAGSRPMLPWTICDRRGAKPSSPKILRVPLNRILRSAVRHENRSNRPSISFQQNTVWWPRLP